MPLARWRRAVVSWTQLTAAVLSTLVIAHVCQDPADGSGVYRELGGGLVLGPDGQVFSAFALPGAVAEEELTFWRSQEEAAIRWPLPPSCFGCRTPHSRSGAGDLAIGRW